MVNSNIKKLATWGGIAIFFVLIIGYAAFISKDLVFGVKIKDINLLNGEKVADSIVKITGNAKNAVFLALDGREISIDEKGNFNETVALLPGYNIVSVIAKDKFGYVDQKNYQLIY